MPPSDEPLQIGLPLVEASAAAYGPIFRRVYFHLYSNSNASRAETIISDLANLLLCKAADDRSGGGVVDKFLSGKVQSSALIDGARRAYPLLLGDKEAFRLEETAVRAALSELRSIKFNAAPGHVLGEAFQALIGPRLRGDRGQFFTPRSLVKAIVAVVNPKKGSKIVDPACGTGGFLSEALIHIRGDAHFIGIDKDADLAKLAESMLEMMCPDQATVLNCNSLDQEALRALPSNANPFDADFVLTNPPFGVKIKVTDENILRQYELGHQWMKAEKGWARTDTVLDGQDPQILFIELCIRLLRDGGRLGIVLPEGVFGNKGQEYIWEFIRKNGRVEALIDCPRTTFQPSTDVKTNVLVFEKGRATRIKEAWIAVAVHCGHDRRGRTELVDGSPYPDDFREIGTAFRRKSSPWQKRKITNPTYLVPRYYDAPEASWVGQSVAFEELIKNGELDIRKGDEVGSEAYGTGDIPFVRTSDISNYEISIDPTKGVSEETYSAYAASQGLKPGAILMIADGRYRIGRTAIITKENCRCVVQSHIKIISPTEKCRFDPYELLYLLNLPEVQRQIRNLVFIQSTLGSLGSRLKEVLVPIPARNSEWTASIERFQKLIEGRAKLLHELAQFEHGDLEL